jgi:hypothetical protein
LERAGRGHQGTLSLIGGPMKGCLGDVALWALNLAASLGPAWDGDWWRTTSMWPSSPSHPRQRQGQRRGHAVLVAAYGQHSASSRREARPPSMLLFDEFGSLAGGRALARGPGPSQVMRIPHLSG